jgi:hypothetical protein
MRYTQPSLILAILTTLPVSLANAQGPVTLQEQLAAQYKLVQMTGNGTVVVEPGTQLSVQKGGIIGLPFKAVVHCAAKFQDNSLHPSTGFCAGMMKSVSQYMQKGSKVYPLKIEVSLDKAKISFQVVSCDSCNGVDPPTGMKGEVVFQFAKGYLEKASVGEVEDTIGQVFAISSDDQQGQGDAAANQQQQQQEGGQQQQSAPPQQQQAEPQTVQLGMTTDQVQTALGSPEKIFNLGSKQIYVYKDVKVTFLNGKVSDVQ